MALPEGIYPFSTQDGKTIPLDIIKVRSIIVQPFVKTGMMALVIPADAVVAVLYSKAGCVLRFGDTVVPSVFPEGEEVSNCILIPEGGIITTVLTPGTASVIGLDGPGTLYIQLIEQWAAIGLPTQYGRK